MTEYARSYSELSKLTTFEERFNYLICNSEIGIQTFGNLRYLNQSFYKDPLWLSARDQAILRDRGFDLGLEGAEIVGLIVVHHINPITIDDVRYRRACLFDLENLICASDKTHKGLHYGRRPPTTSLYKQREPNDTIPWKKVNKNES